MQMNVSTNLQTHECACTHTHAHKRTHAHTDMHKCMYRKCVPSIRSDFSVPPRRSPIHHPAVPYLFEELEGRGPHSATAPALKSTPPGRISIASLELPFAQAMNRRMVRGSVPLDPSAPMPHCLPEITTCNRKENHPSGSQKPLTRTICAYDFSAWGLGWWGLRSVHRDRGDA